MANTGILGSDYQVGYCCMYSGGSATYSTAIFGVPTTCTNASEALAWLVSQGCEFTYKLKTPLTYQLTPTQVTTLLGQNNIFADTGDTEVVYFADTKLYIQKLTGSTEEDMVANQNIPSGKYFLVGNSLFLSSQAIAQGASIVVGTNCTRTNLAEALNALNA